MLTRHIVSLLFLFAISEGHRFQRDLISSAEKALDQPSLQNNTCSPLLEVTKVYVLVPLSINTYIAENATYPIYDYFTLNVSNAPTSLNALYTGTSTSYISRGYPGAVMNTYSQPGSDFSYVDGYQFILNVIVAGDSHHDNALFKRQTNAFLGQGQATDSCSNAVIYSLVNGQLFANTSSGSMQFGTNTGVSYANFTPSTNPGTVIRTFSVDSTNNLIWNNVAFYNNFARFCVLPDNTVVAVFADPQTAPANCLFVTLSMTRVSTCAAAAGGPQLSGPSDKPQGATGITGPSGATGPSGPSGPPGASGASGLSGLSGQLGPSGPSGASGASGIAGATGQQGPQGAVGPSGPSGPSGASGASGNPGASGQQGAQGPVGPSGPSGPSGALGASGASGIPGASGQQGAQGPVGPSGPSGAQGASGASGIPGSSGQQGAQGLVGPSGPSGPSGVAGSGGPSGPSGPSGASGPSGPQGSSGVNGLTFAFLGCYTHTCTASGCTAVQSCGLDTSSTNCGFNTTLTGSTSQNVDSQCAALCLTKTGTNYFGTVNSGTSSGDCYCGSSLNGATSLLTNCGTCVGGQGVGQCGRQGQTIAVYARAF